MAYKRIIIGDCILATVCCKFGIAVVFPNLRNLQFDLLTDLLQEPIKVNVGMLRRLDFWVGLPACALLTASRYLGRLLGGDKQGDIKKILFVKLAEQGSTVLAVEAFEYAARLVGRENLYFLVFEENRFIVDALGIVPEENVIAVCHDSIPSLFRSGLRALRKMHSEKIDAAADFEFFSRASAALTYLSKAKRRVGFHAYGTEGLYRGDLFTHRVIYNPHLHTSQSFLSLVQILAAPADILPATPISVKSKGLEPKKYEPSASDKQTIEKLLLRKAENYAGSARQVSELGPIILLNANCGDMLPLRRWPQDRYLVLANHLLRQYPEVLVAFTGAAAESSGVNELVREISNPRCFSVAGETTLPGLLTLYGMAEVLVTNDSGPAHFASLTDIDVVTLFGPETPALFGSLSSRSHNLWAGLACSPCVSAYNNRTSSCQNNLCMKFLTADHVSATVCRAYDARVERRKQTANSENAVMPKRVSYG